MFASLSHFSLSLLSLLSGLEYQDRRSGAWEKATQAGNETLTLTINVGDMFEVLTNGRVPAPVHRVVCEPGCPLPRYSIAVFFNPTDTAVISPIMNHMTGNKKLYKDVAWAEFRRQRFLGDSADVGRETQVSDYKIKS